MERRWELEGRQEGGGVSKLRRERGKGPWERGKPAPGLLAPRSPCPPPSGTLHSPQNPSSWETFQVSPSSLYKTVDPRDPLSHPSHLVQDTI